MMLPIVTLGLGLTATVHAAILHSGPGWSIRNEVPYDYYESTITWTGFPEVGVETELYGTIEDILAKHPNIEKSLRTYMDDPGRSNGTSQAREDGDPPSENFGWICDERDIGHSWGDWTQIGSGVSYLRKLPDDRMCGNQAAKDGKGACGRISCSYNSGIWWCNDNPHDVSYRCNVFGDFAEKIRAHDGCYAGEGIYGEPLQARGQGFDWDHGINVIIGRSNEYC